VADKLAVLENDGSETSRLRLVSFDDNGAVTKQLAERRLTGSAAEAPLVSGRRLIVATDRGQIEIYDIGSDDNTSALALVARRDASGNQPVARHVALVGRNLWIGDSQLTKYSVLPTGNRLTVESIEDNFAGATFDHPFAISNDSLIHVHRPKRRAGAVVAATETRDGGVLWQTDVAIPPAGPPIVDASAKTLTAANAEGYLFRFDEAAIQSRVQDQPLTTQATPADLPALTAAVDLGQGRAAFCAPGADRLLLYNPALGDRAAQWIKLESPLACEVAQLGEGIVAPLQVGQVFYYSSADGSKLAMPFQPRLAPRITVDYRPVGIVDQAARRFVIAAGGEKIYLVAAVDQPRPHLAAVAEAAVGPYPISSPIVVVGNMAVAIGDEEHLLRFHLPSLEPAGESKLTAPVVWGPFAVGEGVLLATADEHLVSISVGGEERWRVPLEHGDLCGRPLVAADSVLIAYRKGILERRAAADGKPLATVDVEHPLAAGPVSFSQRIVLAAHDGTLLVVDQP
jgi:hypothetical protein